MLRDAVELVELASQDENNHSDLEKRPCRKRIHLETEFKLEDKSTKSNLVRFLRRLENFAPAARKHRCKQANRNSRSESNPIEVNPKREACQRALSSSYEMVHSDSINNTTSTTATNRHNDGEYAMRSSRLNERYFVSPDSFATVIGQSPSRAQSGPNGYFAQAIGQGATTRHFSPRTPMSRTDKAQRILEIHSGPCNSKKRLRSPSNPNTQQKFALFYTLKNSRLKERQRTSIGFWPTK